MTNKIEITTSCFQLCLKKALVRLRRRRARAAKFNYLPLPREPAIRMADPRAVTSRMCKITKPFLSSSLLLSFLPSYLPSFLSSFLLAFLPALLPSSLTFFLLAFLSAFLPSSLTFFLPFFLPSFLPSGLLPWRRRIDCKNSSYRS